MTNKRSRSHCSEEIIPLPSPGPGTHRHITVLRYGKPGNHPKFYFQTALHADEIPGMVVIHHLRKLLDVAAEQGNILGEIILVPVANPIGMSQRIHGNLEGRLDLNNGKNYNRYYPDLYPGVKHKVSGRLGDNEIENVKIIRSAIKEEICSLPELTEGDAYRKILLTLSSDSDYCIDLHCDEESIIYLYSGGTHPIQERILGAFLQCQLHLVDSTTTQCFDGSISLLWKRLAAAFSDKPIPMSCLGSTLELRGKKDVSDEYASQDANNLFDFLVHEAAVAGELKQAPGPLCDATPLEAQIYVKSPETGIVLYRRRAGESVKKGELVAEILDPLAIPDQSRTCIYAPISGVIMSRSDQRLVGPGQNVMAIVGKEIIAERVGKHLLSD